MAGSSVLLDTNIVAAYFNREEAIRQRLSGSTILVPSIVLGELYFGAYGSQRAQQNLQQIRDFIALNTIPHADEATAETYGQVKLRLRLKGRPIPDNDIWIAAIALQHGLTLVSRNEHFNEVEGFSLEKW